MSKETMQHLNTQTLIGFTEKRGTAWHYRAEDQGEESNHYDRAIPVEDVHRRLFNWDPITAPLSATVLTEDGVTSSEVPNRKAILRSDTLDVLGVMSDSYEPHPYGEWLVDTVADILDADLAIGSAGLLKGGAQAWVQVEMEETLNVAGISFRPFLTACTSLDGSLATTYTTGAQVVVCDNTLSAALRDGDAPKVRIKHTANSHARLSDVRGALGIVFDVADAFTEQVQELTADRVSDAEWHKFVDAYTGRLTASEGRGLTMAENKADALNDLYFDDERAGEWRGSAWGVVAAVNTFVHHGQTVRGKTRAERNAERMVRGEHDALDRNTLKVLASVR